MRNWMMSRRERERMKRAMGLDRNVYRPSTDEIGRRVRLNMIRSAALRRQEEAR